MKRLARRIAPIVVVLFVLAGCGQGTPGTTKTPGPTGTSEPTGGGGQSGPTVVKIGVSNPFSGGAAFHGLEAIKGVQIAVAELNEEQDDYVFVTVVADDECTPDGGRAALTKLTQVDKVNVLLTSNCSGAVLGGMDVLQQQRIPGVVTAATNPAITEQAGVGGNEYIFRINSMDAMFAEYFGQYISDEGVSTIAFFATNNDYGRGVVGAFKEKFSELGVEVTTEQYFEQGTSDFRAQLTAIDASGAEAILAPANHPDAIVMLRQMQELGMDQKVYARSDTVSLAFLEAAGDPHLGDGVEEASYWDASLSQDPDFRTKLNERFGSEPSLNSYVTYWGIQVIYQAILNGGGAEPEQIRAGLAAMDFETPLGRVKFNDHNQAQSDVFILGFVDGQIVLINEISTQ